MTTELDMNIAAAELGEQARDFKDSELGRYMLGIAAQHIQFAQEKLADVNPESVKEIRELQNQIWCAKHFMQWLDEAIDIGGSAVEVWQQQQQEVAG